MKGAHSTTKSGIAYMPTRQAMAAPVAEARGPPPAMRAMTWIRCMGWFASINLYARSVRREPSRSLCEAISLLPKLTVLSAQADPASDLGRARVKLARQLLGHSAGADEFDHLAPELRRVGQDGYGHQKNLRLNSQNVHYTGSTLNLHPIVGSSVPKIERKIG